MTRERTMDAESTTRARRARLLDLACGAALVLGTLAHVAYYFPRVVDDLFISLRYAENFASGRGAVFNPGDRIEGYSSPLWMFLQSVGFVLHVDGVTWTKLLGVLSLLALEWGLFRLTRRSFGVAGPLAFLPGLCCAANSYVVNWAVLGLETPIHLALLVLVPVALDAFLKAPSRKTRGLGIAALVCAGLARPESPAYVVLSCLAAAVPKTSFAEVPAKVRTLARVVVPAAAVLALFLVSRFLYYRHLVPNTYFVKGQGEGFQVARLAPLWEQGATKPEEILYLGGVVLLAVFGFLRRATAPFLVAAFDLYFAASVHLDWMPSLRHLLPVTILAPLGWACLADLALSRPGWIRGLAVLPVGLPLVAAWDVAGADVRNSPEDRHGRAWVRPKNRAKWEDTVLAYRRIEPPHVRRMGNYDMGQITQAWHVLETSAEPVESSWYVGRDIGAVGFYTGVRVFDTAGLFTSVVSFSRDWVERRQVSDEVVRRAMALRPLAADLFEGWGPALGRNPGLLANYKVLRGSPRYPLFIVAKDRKPPERAEILRRYRAFVAKFPRAYHLHTLYGESVGAVVEKRLRYLESGGR